MFITATKNRSRTLLAALTIALAGCASEINVKDGQTYYGSAKVHYSGVLEAIRLYDANEQEHLLAVDKDGDLALDGEKLQNIAQAANDNTPFHDLFASGPLIFSLVALPFMKMSEDRAAQRGRPYSDLLIRLPDGELKALPLMNDMLKQHIRSRCVELDEPVMVIDGPRNALVPAHGDPRLQRNSDLLPSCRILRERYGYPPPLTIWK